MKNILKAANKGISFAIELAMLVALPSRVVFSFCLMPLAES